MTILDYTLVIKIPLLSKSGFLKILFPGYLIYIKNRSIRGRRIFVRVE